MRKHMPTAAHPRQLQLIQNFRLWCLIHILLRQINDLRTINTSGHFSFCRLANIVAIFIGQNLSTSETANWDNHVTGDTLTRQDIFIFTTINFIKIII